MKRALVAIVACGLAGALLAMPAIAGPYLLYMADLTLAYVVISVGFNILLGFAGQFAFANAAFMGIGAYTLALLMSRLGLGLLIALPAAGVTAAVLGLVVALPSLRMNNVYLAMVTMAFAELVQWVLIQWKVVTLGTQGVDVPSGSIGPVHIGGADGVYYVILSVTILCVVLAHCLLHSCVGRSFAAVRQNEIMAQCSGINIARTKAIAFCASAVLSGIGGGLFALSLGYIVPDGFGFLQLIVQFAMVLIGGLGSLAGAIIGAALLTVLPEILRGAEAYQEIVYGSLLVAFVVFLPKGVAGLLKDRGLLPREILVRGWRRYRREHRINPLVAPAAQLSEPLAPTLAKSRTQ